MTQERLNELGIPRRSFLKKSGAVFVAPVVVSFALDGVAEAQASSMPNQSFPNQSTTLLAARARLGLLTITFSATLTASSGGAPLPGETITFSVCGRSVGSATTNSSGVASRTELGLVLPLGQPTYTASFAGDSTYLASSSTAPL
jgi:hypothetical protein